MLRARHSYSILPCTARTSDGVRLSIKRYAREGGQPVVLMHGFAQNHQAWDLPIFGRSFAEFLAHRGFDVWCANLRGHGRPPFRSEEPSTAGWTVDHYAAHDVPAIVDAVLEATGRAPFWIGHSMGGLVAYMYLQGARLETRAAGLVLEADPGLARERNREKLRGVITLGSPARFEMETGLNAVYGLASLAGERGRGARLIRRPGLARRMLQRMQRVPIRTLVDLFKEGEERPRAPLTGFLRRALHLSAREATRIVTSRDIWYRPNVSREILGAALEHTIDDVCARVALQFVDWIDHRTFRSDLAHVPAGGTPFVYCENFERIECPILIGCGVRDRIACIGTMERVAFRGVSSRDKTFLPIPEAGHVDVLYGVKSSATLYPILGSWMANRI